MDKELLIKTQTVEIKLITVGGKKMTKSVFNQIQNELCFDSNFNFNGDSFLGYVVDCGKHLIYIKNGELRKFDLSLLIRLTQYDIDADKHSVCYILYFTGVDFIFHNFLNTQRILIENEKDKLISNKRNAISFMQKLSNSQLYIAI
jgi:hypothetical protein